MRRLTLALSSVLLALLVVLPVSAFAEFTPPMLLSATSRQQFEEANAPVLSGDGRYVVFQGTLNGIAGIYRRDLQTGGEPELVVGGAAAAAPSVSETGQYIAFTSTTDLDPQTEPGGAGEPEQDRGCPEVYVADMGPEPAVGESSKPTYKLASALNESATGIAYQNGCSGPVSGAQAAAGVAISASGQQVVFTVLSSSDLSTGARCTSPAAGLQPECTEPSQVVVRDIETKTTTLVSVTPEGRPTPHGGAFPSTGSLALIRGLGKTEYGEQLTASTAAINAEGNTVAWIGTNVPSQVPSSAAELESEAATGPQFPGREALGDEVEPLWRRVSDGASAVTLRLLAGAGLDFFYPNLTLSQFPVNTGAFVGEKETVFIPPALSGNGDTVALIASAPTPALVQSLAERESELPTELSTDAYVIRVGEGSSPQPQPQATALTRVVGYDLPQSRREDVRDIAISPEGTRIAFETARTPIYTPSIEQISPEIQFAVAAQTYEVNLALGTMQRVTTSYDGAQPNGEAGLLAFSGDGETLAFASTATNLFYGDGVLASQVYDVHEVGTGAEPTPEAIGAAPSLETVAPEWVMGATAVAQPDGSVLLDAQVPGAGRLTVAASAQLPAPVAGRRARAKRATKAGKHAKRSSASFAWARRSGAAVSPILHTRTVATASSASDAPTELVLTLRAGSAYQTRVSSRTGLYALLRVTFTAPGRPTLVREVPVTFHDSEPPARAAYGAKPQRGKTSGREGRKRGIRR